ncbi:alpha/beta fold hydrolase [Geodermatophilus amargosae]|uniref:alpha/beta fold hydrolase n=1 Tax=Geodermatophilus amargosae TaxID=1296565 RepID=UPI0034E01966
MSPNDTETPSGRRIATRLGALRVREVGSGPPAVLWHSLFVDSTTWQRMESRLAAERQLIVVDGPGHGSSGDAGHDYTLDDCAGAASDVLDQSGVTEPVDWLGNAWGGHVGAAFAASEPDRCRTLTAVCAPVHALEPAVRRQMRASIPVYRLLGPIRPFVETLTHGGLLSPHPDPEDAQLVADAFRRADRRGMARAMTCISLRRTDLTPMLPAVTVPTLMIAAADDPLWRPEQARAAVRAMHRATTITVPGGGHVEPLLRSAPLLAQIIIAFWRAPPGVLAGSHGEPASREPRRD